MHDSIYRPSHQRRLATLSRHIQRVDTKGSSLKALCDCAVSKATITGTSLKLK
uniref:Uncharacterized protein n=1 Tax=Arundo donax TaxID=35708 RepID=A0A0A9E391_ARUDO